MNIRDYVKLVGGVAVIVYNPDGSIRSEQYSPNLITTIGLERGASHLASPSVSNSWFSHVGFSASVIAATIDTLALTDPFYRVVLDSVTQSGSSVIGRVLVTATDIGASTYSISQLGLFDALAGGNLICMQVLGTAVSITGSDQAEVIWAVTLT